MSDTLTAAIDKLATDVRERMDAVDRTLSDATSDARLNELIASNFDTHFRAWLASSEGEQHMRKMRWGAPDSQLVGTKYARMGMGVADVELLYDVLQAAHQARLSRGPSEELTRTWEAVSEGRYLSTALARADDERALVEMRRSGRLDEVGYRRAMRAMDTAESGYGSQLIGAQYVGELWDAARRESRIFNLIDSIEMTEATTYVPVEADIPEMLYVGESTSPTASDYTTSKTGSNRVQLSPGKFIIHQVFSGEMEEDSVVPYLPYLRRQANLSMQHYSDSLVLNGDTTNAATGNINLDDADPADSKHYLAFDGIRHAALVDNTNNRIDAAGVVTYDLLRRLPGLMVDDTYLMDWGHPAIASDLVYISDPRTADRIALLDELITVDKYGANATVLTGEVARVGMHPLVVSMAMSRTEADGKVSTTAANNTKGQVSAFNVRGFKAGWRRRVTFKVEDLPGRDQTRWIWSLRLAFTRYSPTGAASGIESTATLYDITLP